MVASKKKSADEKGETVHEGDSGNTLNPRKMGTKINSGANLKRCLSAAAGTMSSFCRSLSRSAAV